MKSSLYSLLLVLLCIDLSSQSLTDALRYSSILPGGTSRIIGAGSSFGAMGGDFGVISINPAGLADFRSSELMFSFSFNGGDTRSSLSGNDYLKTGHLHEPRLENIGVVFNSSNQGSGLVNSNLAIGLMQYSNFNQDFAYEGYSKGSITERFAELANGRNPEFFDPFEAELAWETGAIFDFDGDLVYETDIDTIQEIYKSQNVSRSGKINELAFAWAGKFDNDFSIGLGIGIPFVSFEEDKNYNEQDLDDRIPFFNNLGFSERLVTSGEGYNFKLGLGYVYKKSLRFGFSYQSPTYYSLDDNYNTSMTYSFTDSSGKQDYESDSPDGRFSYKLTTPSRLTFSIGTLFKTESLKGFINFDALITNYSNNKFDFTVNNNDPSEAEFEREVNTEIDQQLRSTINYNIGGELVFDRFRVRGGVALMSSAYEIDSATDFNKIYSLGAGYRADRFYLDLAYQFRDIEEGYIPYQVLDQSRLQLVRNDISLNKFSFTLGFKI